MVSTKFLILSMYAEKHAHLSSRYIAFDTWGSSFSQLFYDYPKMGHLHVWKCLPQIGRKFIETSHLGSSPTRPIESYVTFGILTALDNRYAKTSQYFELLKRI